MPLLEHVVQFAQERHGVLAGNIANMNTPGYKTRDLSTEAFQSSLKRAVEASRQPQVRGSAGQAALLTEQGLIASQTNTTFGTMPGNDAYSEVRDAMKSILYHDGTDVSLEKQITEISKNQSQHNMAIRLMATQFNQLRAAISERVT